MVETRKQRRRGRVCTLCFRRLSPDDDWGVVCDYHLGKLSHPAQIDLALVCQSISAYRRGGKSERTLVFHRAVARILAELWEPHCG